MNHPGMSSSVRTQAGVSLIEVLVAVLIVALGMLSMLVMQANASKLSRTSETRTVATMLASDLADRMRANPDGVSANAYAFSDALPDASATPPTFSAGNCESADCDISHIAAYDLAQWRQTVFNTLPRGWARISNYDSDSKAINLWLIWQEPDEHQRDDAPSPIPKLDLCPNGISESRNTSTGVVTAIRCMYFRINL